MSPTVFLAVKSARPQSLRLAFLLLVFIAIGCSDETVAPIPPDTTSGSWVRYTPFNWTHDGRPYESTYVKIFSDEASDAMK
ncbi:MAG: hypothetical protein JSU87_05475, partial [Gemmatimonadota bacterium]